MTPRAGRRREWLRHTCSLPEGALSCPETQGPACGRQVPTQPFSRMLPAGGEQGAVRELELGPGLLFLSGWCVRGGAWGHPGGGIR